MIFVGSRWKPDSVKSPSDSFIRVKGRTKSPSYC